jgi:DNA-directed RNA polymerase specialized sigma subunit
VDTPIPDKRTVLAYVKKLTEQRNEARENYSAIDEQFQMAIRQAFQLGLTARELADAAGVSAQRVIQISGRRGS